MSGGTFSGVLTVIHRTPQTSPCRRPVGGPPVETRSLLISPLSDPSLLVPRPVLSATRHYVSVVSGVRQRILDGDWVRSPTQDWSATYSRRDFPLHFDRRRYNPVGVGRYSDVVRTSVPDSRRPDSPRPPVWSSIVGEVSGSRSGSDPKSDTPGVWGFSMLEGRRRVFRSHH